MGSTATTVRGCTVGLGIAIAGDADGSLWWCAGTCAGGWPGAGPSAGLAIAIVRWSTDGMDDATEDDRERLPTGVVVPLVLGV